MAKFTFYEQLDEMDCGPSCLRMVTGFYGLTLPMQTFRDYCSTNKIGSTLLDISEAAEKLGFRTLGAELEISQLIAASMPCILHWKQSHFVVLYKVSKKYFFIADPALGMMKLDHETFKRHWIPENLAMSGFILLLTPTPQFYQQSSEKQSSINFEYIRHYLFSQKKLLFHLGLTLLSSTIIQLIMPFLTQAIVDIGIDDHNMNFIYLILIGQFVIFIGYTCIEFLRSWILLYINTRINISILTDLLVKLLKLPLQFFETKTEGDILRRISDEKRIETFLTGSAINIAFSIITFVVFSTVVAFYNLTIFFVFGIGTVVYISWVNLFLHQRKKIDYKIFSNNTQNDDIVLELIHGIHEIKLQNSELQRRWKWEHVQAKLFKFNVKSLTLNQYQQAGATLINQTKNILITFFSAKGVVDGHITLGEMVAIQYIIGQLNSPIEQFISIVKSYQDAKISLERINEIHNLEDEEQKDKNLKDNYPLTDKIVIRNLSFTYPGAGNLPALKNINITFQEGKTTAIVGMSGSGKTTLLKLLLRYYNLPDGKIEIGDMDINAIKFKNWRSLVGSVLQEGYIFKDTIINNICIGDDSPDLDALQRAVEIANIYDFINSTPFGLYTMIGSGISQGQKQRILIARAVYKNPSFIFFDEATNALDGNNERIIIGNLQNYFRNKTVIVVAHRLSTVRDADCIIVLENGCVMEQGNHEQLIKRRGSYFELIKNQLELAGA